MHTCITFAPDFWSQFAKQLFIKMSRTIRTPTFGSFIDSLACVTFIHGVWIILLVISKATHRWVLRIKLELLKDALKLNWKVRNQTTALWLLFVFWIRKPSFCSLYTVNITVLSLCFSISYCDPSVPGPWVLLWLPQLSPRLPTTTPDVFLPRTGTIRHHAPLMIHISICKKELTINYHFLSFTILTLLLTPQGSPCALWWTLTLWTLLVLKSVHFGPYSPGIPLNLTFCYV